jgi:Matrixin
MIEIMVNTGTKWVAIALALCGATFARTSPSHAYALLKTNSGKSVHWDRATVVVVPGKSTSANLSSASVRLSLTEAIRAWNGLPEMKLRFTTDDTPKPEVKVEFCKGSWRFKAGLLATTEFQASVTTGVITSATIIVNECDYKFVGPEEVEGGALDLQATLAHELGHVLGLAHSEEATAVMFESTGSVRQRRPMIDDRVGLAAIYDPDFKPRETTAATAPSVVPTAPAKPGLAAKSDIPKSEELPWDDVEVVKATPQDKKKAIPIAAAAAVAKSIPKPTGKPQHTPPSARSIKAPKKK